MPVTFSMTSPMDEIEDDVTITVRRDLDLDDLLETFERFARACGYEFKGKVGIITFPEEDSAAEEFADEDFDDLHDTLLRDHQEQPITRESLTDAARMHGSDLDFRKRPRGNPDSTYVGEGSQPHDTGEADARYYMPKVSVDPESGEEQIEFFGDHDDEPKRDDDPVPEQDT